MPANLLLHCGAHAVPRSILDSTPTPPATTTWQPVPHSRFVESVEQVLPDYGFRVVQQAHGLTHDGNRYFGLLEVQNGCNSPDYTWVLGLRNSHDMSLPAGLVAGSQVFVCDNLAFSGEVKVSRKHTRFIMRDLPGKITEVLDRLVQAWHDQDRRVNAYKNCRLNDKQAHDLTIRALDHKVIPASRIPAVLSEWREPCHNTFHPRNTWSWFNAVTEVLKGRLHDLPRRTIALHEICDQQVGLDTRRIG